MNVPHTTQLGFIHEPLADVQRPAEPGAGSIEAFILLDGALTPSPLTAATRCSVLDLLIGPGGVTVLDRWLAAIDSLGGLASRNMPIIIASGGGAPAPVLSDFRDGRSIRIVADEQSYRGAAGVVADVSRTLSDDALLCVAEAARAPDFDLAQGIEQHLASGNDATVFVNPDRTPAGVYLIARRLLNLVQREGYMDLKEQWLARVIEKDGRVGARRIEQGCCRPLRTREQLLSAARAAAEAGGREARSLRFGLDGGCDSIGAFNCIAPDARIDQSALVIDSIVMSGAAVGRGAVVTRSIICRDCSISQNSSVIDAIQTSHGKAGRNGAVSNERHWERDT